MRWLTGRRVRGRGSRIGRWAAIGSAVSAVASWAGAARAADPAPTPLLQGVRVDVLQPASPESAFFRSYSSHKPQDSGIEFAVRVTLDEGFEELKELRVDTAGHTESPVYVVKNAILARVAGSLSPVHWLSLELGIPFALAELGNKPPPFGGVFGHAGKGPGIGDPNVGVHFRVIEKPDFGFLFGGRVWGPFATKSTYLGDGNARAEVDLAVTGERDKYAWGLTASIAPAFFASRDGDRIALSGAGYFNATKWAAIGIEPSVALVQDVTPRIQSDATKNAAKNVTAIDPVFEPLAGARFRVGLLRFGVAAGPGFGGAGAAAFRALADVGIVIEGKPPPPPPSGPSDRDLDGIPDSEDACPDDAGPRSSDPTKNGCPIHDRDGDGVLDADDFCPDRPGIKYPDPKGNGCPDSDNDGIPDPLDACPNEPGKGQGGCPIHARLGKDAFDIKPPIVFAANSDRLTSEARAAIEEVAATVHANPKTIDQVSFGIGTKGAAAALSDKRAQAVLLVLRAAALESERYEVVLRDDLPNGKVVVRVLH